MLKCPVCGQMLLEIRIREGRGVACDQCVFSLTPKQRSKPHEHVTQRELDNAKHVRCTYNYYMETLRHG